MMKAVLLLIYVVFSPANAFTVQPCPWYASLSSPLWTSRPATFSGKRYMAESADPEAGAEPDKQENEDDASSSSSPELEAETDSSNSMAEDISTEGGMWKTVLLAGPLFLKFVVVLV